MSNTNGHILKRVLESPFDESQIPTLPEMFLQLREDLKGNVISVKKISKTILMDPALTLRTLSVIMKHSKEEIGSPYIPFQKSVKDMGLNRLREMMKNYVLLHDPAELKSKSLFDLYAYWKHSIYAAYAAETIAEFVDYTCKEEAYVAGLLHDIGKLIVAQFAPTKSWKIQKIYRAHSDYHKIEMRILKTSHTLIGESIAADVGTPKNIVDAIRSHDMDAGEEGSRYLQSNLTRIVSVANSISKLFCFRDHSNHYFFEGSEKASSLLGLDQERYRTIVRKTGNRIHSLIDRFHEHAVLFRNYSLELERLTQKDQNIKKRLDETENTLQQRDATLNMYNDIVPAINTRKSRAFLYNELAKTIIKNTDIKYVVFFLYDKATKLLESRYSCGLAPNDQLRYAKFDSNGDNNVFASTFKDQKIHNILKDDVEKPVNENNNNGNELRRFPFATLPIVENKKPLGVMLISHGNTERIITNDFIEIISKLCNHISVAVESISSAAA